MGCEGLLTQLWCLKSEDMARKFSQERSNEWEGTIRQDPEQWTVDSWAEVYSFRKEGRGLALRTEKYVDGKFSTLINPKDGHAVVDCVDLWEHEKLVFSYVVHIYIEPR